MKNRTPSRLRREISWNLAEKLVYKCRGAKYNTAINPYKVSFDSHRFERFYSQIREKYHFMEKEFKQIAEVYGLDTAYLKIND